METIRPEDVNFDRARLREDVLRNFETGYNCAETVVAAFAKNLGVDREVMRLATPFGAGLGGRRDLCGLLTGGAMIIGLLFGRDDPEKIEEKTVTYKLAGQYYRWFKTQKMLRCSEIVTGRFTGHTDVCVRLADEAQAVLADIIATDTKGDASRR